MPAASRRNQMNDRFTEPPKALVPESDLPARYQTPWRPTFVAQAREHSRPGMTTLDVAGCRVPTLPPEFRPANSTYIGLDPDAEDLANGDYDIRVRAGASDPQRDLVGHIDLIISWNVLEHVPDMPSPITCFHTYLRLGGVLLARLAGRWAFFEVASRLMPHRVRMRLLACLIGATPDKPFSDPLPQLHGAWF